MFYRSLSALLLLTITASTHAASTPNVMIILADEKYQQLRDNPEHSVQIRRFPSQSPRAEP